MTCLVRDDTVLNGQVCGRNIKGIGVMAVNKKLNEQANFTVKPDEKELPSGKAIRNAVHSIASS